MILELERFKRYGTESTRDYDCAGMDYLLFDHIFANSHSTCINNYCLNQCGALLHSLTQSSYEDVQEIIVNVLLTFTFINHENVVIDSYLAKAISRESNILLIFNIAKA